MHVTEKIKEIPVQFASKNNSCFSAFAPNVIFYASIYQSITKIINQLSIINQLPKSQYICMYVCIRNLDKNTS